MKRVLVLALLVPGGLRAQDSTQTGVRIGITYAPGTRPALSVVPYSAALLDTASTVLARDLEQSDRFEMMSAPAAARGQEARNLDLRPFTAMGAAFVVTLSTEADGVYAVVVDARSGQQSARTLLFDAGARDRRLAVHRGADEIVRAIAGQPGIAATRVLFVRNGRIMRLDADGANAELLHTAGWPALSPAWHPDGRRFAYTAFVRSGQPIVVQDFGGRREMVPGTDEGLNITPSFSPDGRWIAYAHGTEAGMDIYLSEQAGGGGPEGGAWGPPQRLTAGRFADNLSPVWSPDGSRIAFISNRARSPQLYVMSADGTGQEVLARFDFGATGTTSAPAWSPDGSLIAFHREVGGTPQVFVLDVAARSLRQITGASRNEDPSWAPDGRHLVFVSSRTGPRELWIVDLETGRLRQLTRLGGTRLPAWSPRLSPSEGRE